MKGSSGPEEDTQPSTQSPSEALARRLLTIEVGEKTSSEEFAAAGERVYLRLRERLAVLLGATGFDALWARSMQLAQPTFRARDDAAAENESFPTQGSRADGLRAAVHGRAADAVQHNLVAMFARFITLLFTFIGAELSLRFIRQIWPELPPDAAAVRAEEATE